MLAVDYGATFEVSTSPPPWKEEWDQGCVFVVKMSIVAGIVVDWWIVDACLLNL